VGAAARGLAGRGVLAPSDTGGGACNRTTIGSCPIRPSSRSRTPATGHWCSRRTRRPNSARVAGRFACWPRSRWSSRHWPERPGWRSAVPRCGRWSGRRHRTTSRHRCGSRHRPRSAPWPTNRVGLVLPPVRPARRSRTVRGQATTTAVALLAVAPGLVVTSLVVALVVARPAGQVVARPVVPGRAAARRLGRVADLARAAGRVADLAADPAVARALTPAAARTAVRARTEPGCG
jgi:hypothetical protein